MKKLSASELLDFWEQAHAQQPVLKALTLLNAAWPEISFDELANFSIGERDERLLTLREQTFGSNITGLINCPNCGEVVELNFSTKDISMLDSTNMSSPGNCSDNKSMVLNVHDFEVRFRLPTTRDLIELAENDNLESSKSLLVQRCLLSIQRNGEGTSKDNLPEEVLDAVEAHMAKSDPQADIQLSIDCPSCNHKWESTFDILSFFCFEIDAWARRILQEIHTLASSYGWSQDDILSMSSIRRQIYLEMLSG